MNRATASADADADEWPWPVSSAIIQGRRLEFVDAGTGQAVVLVHGTGSSWRVWQRTIEALSREYRVIALSLPGCGDSERFRTSPRDLGPYADTIVSLLDDRGINLAVAVGHSLGGLACLRLVSSYPDRIQALVAVDSGGGTMSNRRLLVVTRGLRIVQSLCARPWFVRSVVHREWIRARLFSSVVFDASVISPALIAQELRSFAAPGVNDSIRAGIAEQKLLRPEEIATPTALIWGRHDRIVPLSIAESLCGALQSATLAVIENSGHAPMLEQPDQFNELLRSGIRTCLTNKD